MVASPGKLPITGNETVLDAINYAGGLVLPLDAETKIRLIRPEPPGGSSEHVFKIDLRKIVVLGDPTTNYQLMPGDRLIVFGPQPTDPEAAEAELLPTLNVSDKSLERRLSALERKLDLILKRLDASEKKPN